MARKKRKFSLRRVISRSIGLPTLSKKRATKVVDNARSISSAMKKGNTKRSSRLRRKPIRKVGVQSADLGSLSNPLFTRFPRAF